MFRKLVSSAIIILLATLGLAQTASANATERFSAKAVMPAAAVQGQMLAISNSATLSVWLDVVNGVRYLRSGILHDDGTFDSQTDIVSYAQGHVVSGPQTGSLVLTKDGTVALVWTHTVFDGDSGFSELQIAYSQDGIEWSAPMQVLPAQTLANDFYCEIGCGYLRPVIGVDKFNTLGVAVNLVRSGESSEVVATSSKDGAIWAPAASIQNGSGIHLKITALPQGGFISTWASYSDDWYAKFATMSTKILNFWSPTKTIGLTDSISDLNVAQTDPSHMSLFYITRTNDTPVIKQRTFDVVAKSWSSEAILATLQVGFTYNNLMVDVNSNWKAAIAVGSADNGLATGYANLVEFKNSVPRPAMVALSTTAEQGITVTGLKVNFDDSVTLVTKGLAQRPLFITVKDGLELDRETVPTFSSSNTSTMVTAASRDGNFGIILASDSAPTEGFYFRGAQVPIVSGSLALKGKAVKGQTLSARIPIFGGRSAIGVTTFTWYSCSAKISTPTFARPVSCIAIPKATSSRFKVTSKQKGKYLSLAVSNTNAVGTTTLFSPTTAKAK